MDRKNSTPSNALPNIQSLFDSIGMPSNFDPIPASTAPNHSGCGGHTVSHGVVVEDTRVAGSIRVNLVAGNSTTAVPHCATVHPVNARTSASLENPAPFHCSVADRFGASGAEEMGNLSNFECEAAAYAHESYMVHGYALEYHRPFGAPGAAFVPTASNPAFVSRGTPVNDGMVPVAAPEDHLQQNCSSKQEEIGLGHDSHIPKNVSGSTGIRVFKTQDGGYWAASDRNVSIGCHFQPFHTPIQVAPIHHMPGLSPNNYNTNPVYASDTQYQMTHYGSMLPAASYPTYSNPVHTVGPYRHSFSPEDEIHVHGGAATVPGQGARVPEMPSAEASDGAIKGKDQTLSECEDEALLGLVNLKRGSLNVLRGDLPEWNDSPVCSHTQTDGDAHTFNLAAHSSVKASTRKKLFTARVNVPGVIHNKELTKQRKPRSNWTDMENSIFFSIVQTMQNEKKSDREIIGAVLQRLGLDRTPRQVQGHLRNMRIAKKV